MSPIEQMDNTEARRDAKPIEGWLEVGPDWLAELWGLKATGQVKVIPTGGLPKIHVGVAGVAHAGQIVTGLLARALVPTAIVDKAEHDARMKSAPGRG